MRYGTRRKMLYAFMAVLVAVAAAYLARPHYERARAYSYEAEAGRTYAEVKAAFPGVGQRKVEVTEPAEPLSLLSAFGSGTALGSYDADRGTITIYALPWYGAVFTGRNALLHEYGHAAVQDVLTKKLGRGKAAETIGQLIAFEQLDEPPASWPEELRLASLDYSRTASEYGEYAGSSFGEWLAESFAASVKGKTVPQSIETLYAPLR